VRQLRLVAVILAVMAAVSSCAVHGLEFMTDRSVAITSPLNRADVQPPFTISWRVRGAGLAGQIADGKQPGYFAVFVDRTPVRPGQSLKVLTDHVCQQTPGCPGPAYLAQLNVYLTRGTSLTVTTLPNLVPQGALPNKLDYLHQVTIVMVNRQLQRIGEASFSINFFSTPPVS
jgi:hypothetical protein